MAILREYKPRLEENGLITMAEQGLFRSESRRITSSGAAARMFSEVFGMKYEAEEVFVCACLNSRGDVVGMFRTCSGSSNNCMFSIREFCKKVLLLNAVSVIVAHNHPGGTCSPSSEDRDLTKSLQEALKLLDVGFLDHIIIPAFSGDYCSFREEGYLP